MLYSTVQCYGDVFKLIFWKFFFNLRNNGTAMAVLAAPLPAALHWSDVGNYRGATFCDSAHHHTYVAFAIARHLNTFPVLFSPPMFTAGRPT